MISHKWNRIIFGLLLELMKLSFIRIYHSLKFVFIHKCLWQRVFQVLISDIFLSYITWRHKRLPMYSITGLENNSKRRKEYYNWFICCMIERVVVQSLSRVWLFATPWPVAHQSSLSFTISWSFLRLTSIESVMLSNHLILCHPLHDWVYYSFKKKMKNICNFASEYSLKYQITESWWKYGGRM